VIGRAAPEDRRQPSPAAAIGAEEIAALPGRSKGILDQIFSLMTIPHKAVSQAVHGGTMVGDHAIEFPNGKRHCDVSLIPLHAYVRGADLRLKGYSALGDQNIPQGAEDRMP
jgi:hypothetical protein